MMFFVGVPTLCRNSCVYEKNAKWRIFRIRKKGKFALVTFSTGNLSTLKFWQLFSYSHCIIFGLSLHSTKKYYDATFLLLTRSRYLLWNLKLFYIVVLCNNVFCTYTLTRLDFFYLIYLSIQYPVDFIVTLNKVFL